MLRCAKVNVVLVSMFWRCVKVGDGPYLIICLLLILFLLTLCNGRGGVQLLFQELKTTIRIIKLLGTAYFKTPADHFVQPRIVLRRGMYFGKHVQYLFKPRRGLVRVHTRVELARVGTQQNWSIHAAVRP